MVRGSTARTRGWRVAGCLLVITPLVSFAQEEYAAPRPAGPSPQALAARDKKNAADAAEWNKNPAPKDPRDFSGVWWTRGYDRTFRPVTDPPESPGEAAKLLPLTAT